MLLEVSLEQQSTRPRMYKSSARNVGAVADDREQTVEIALGSKWGLPERQHLSSEARRAKEDRHPDAPGGREELNTGFLEGCP